jgi:thiol-disulfide isomerase/thioredoxin
VVRGEVAVRVLRNRRWLGVLVAAAVAVAALALAGRLALRSSTPAVTVVQGSARVGQPAPRVELPDLRASSRLVRLADLRGRPAVVNFWASWCEFCAAEMPAFERVHRRLGQRVAFVGVDQRDQRGPALALARHAGVSYRLAFDPSGRSFDAFGGLGMPTTVLLRADHTVAAVFTGQLDEQALVGKLHDDLGVTAAAEAAGAAEPAPLVDPARIIPGGPPPDGIPPIDRPRFQPAGSVGWLAAAEPVAAVQVGGQAKAYPLEILAWHEIVNDIVGGVPVAVTYCPLCNTAITWRRPLVDGAVTTFGTSGKLYQSNLVMYDRATRSLWPQALGQAVTGPLTGQRLKPVPTQIVSWAAFRTGFPDGLVLSRDTGFSRAYGHNPYVGYDAEGSTPFLFDGKVDPRLGATERVLGLTVGGRHLAVPYGRLAARAHAGVSTVDLDLAAAPLLVIWRAGTTSALDRESIAGSRDVGAAAAFSRRLGGRVLTFTTTAGQVRDQQTGSVWDQFGRVTAGPLAGSRLTPAEATDSFWFDWAAFHPDTAVWTG